jgi:hypothetical protein
VKAVVLEVNQEETEVIMEHKEVPNEGATGDMLEAPNY